ncbi:MAG: aminoacetone oxidase family FAD-binding enzyme [Chloroflexi bacterium]|nr:aminoacetone oxidase family FAD-binding enzyme [Chloroflexota bacterium]
MAERNRHIAIVGAGPAGIFAALAARERGARVSLLDTNETVGRKLLVTGNGRCNITNVHASAERYVCADRAFVATALGLFGHPQTVARLRDLAILTYATPDGWCYPLSESAATVVAAFEAALRLAGVEIHLKTKVSDLAPVGGKWQLTIGGGPHKMEADRVIVSSGGKAYPALGSKGELFPVLERLGHHIEPVYPALVPLTAQMRTFHKLQGVRLDAGLRLYEGDRLLGEAVGNLLFTSTGLSGPAAMDLSHLVSTRPEAARQGALRVEIDLLAYHRGALEDLIARQRQRPVPLAVILGAVLPAKVPPFLLEMAGLSPEATLAATPKDRLEHLLYLAGHLSTQVTGTRGLQFAQVSTGGVNVREVDPRTMASRLWPGLYFAGEVLDVIGPCGGFNLQWAFTSGALAGAAAAEEDRTERP